MCGWWEEGGDLGPGASRLRGSHVELIPPGDPLSHGVLLPSSPASGWSSEDPVERAETVLCGATGGRVGFSSCRQWESTHGSTSVRQLA